MKQVPQLLTALLLIVTVSSCKKSTISTSPLASLNVINATVPLAIAATDTTKPVVVTNLNFANGSYYSLFLAGQSGALDTILVKDSYQNYTDSSFGCRFINLSYNSNPISVNIKGKSNGSEVASLSYKQNSGFIKYVATAAFQKD